MRKITALTFLFAAHCIFAQKVLMRYPAGQSPYEGGAVGLFHEMQEFLQKSNLAPCEKNEVYWVNLKIDPSGRPALVKQRGDEARIEENKCAYDLAVKSLGSLRKWRPAEDKGEKVAAYFVFPFYPQHFFQNFTPGYDITTTIKSPVLPGGINAFRKEVQKYLGGYLDWDSYRPAGVFTVSFDVETNGRLTNIDMEPKVANSDRLLRDITSAIGKIKGTWSPATIDGIPVKYRFRMPLHFSSGEYDED